MKLVLYWHTFFLNFSFFNSLINLIYFHVNCKITNLLLALLPIGPALHSISSNFCTSIFWWCCSTRTELVQKWSLLVRILTVVDRISICFFEPGDLRFRPDSGQMEEDLDALQHEQLNQTIFVQEELQQAQDQSEEDLIYLI